MWLIIGVFLWGLGVVGGRLGLLRGRRSLCVLEGHFTFERWAKAPSPLKGPFAGLLLSVSGLFFCVFWGAKAFQRPSKGVPKASLLSIRRK